jgi:hypothetical protein
MKSVQRALYGSVLAAILLAVCFAAFNYFGDYVGLPSSNLGKCGWARVGLDANGDGLFTYRDIFSGLVAIYINTVKLFAAVVSGSSVGQFLELNGPSCLSVTAHAMASLAIGLAYIAISSATLKLAKLAIAVRGSRPKKSSSPSPSNVRHFSMQEPLEGVWSLQLSLSLTTLLIVIVVGLFGSRNGNVAAQNSQPKTEAPKVEYKSREQIKSERSQAAALARSRRSNSDQPQRSASGAADQQFESRTTQSRQDRPESVVVPSQKARAADKQTQSNAARVEALRVEQQRQEQLAEAERQRQAQIAEADRQQANAARAEALRAAQQRQEQMAEAERQRQAQQIQADQARAAAVRRQFEARCNLDLVNAREQARARYQNQCKLSAAANANPFTAAASVLCTLSVDEKTEAYAQTVYQACMSGAPS